MKKNEDDSGYAMICSHIIRNGFPILRAQRDEPLDEIDSGWQFLCNIGHDEATEGAQIWSIKSVIKYEPSLQGMLDQPIGTILDRKNIKSPWIIFPPSSNHQ